MADKVVHHHASETEDHGVVDCFGKKDENKKCNKDEKNESLMDKLHISDSSSSSSDEECKDGEKKKMKKKKKKKKKKDETLKEKVEKKIGEDKVKINVKIEEGKEKVEELKEKTIEKIEEGKEKVLEIKEKLGEKIEEYKEKKEEERKEDSCVPVEKYEDHKAPPPPPPCEVVVHPREPSCEPEEKKGFLEMIKDKLPGGQKKLEEEHTTPPPPPVVVAVAAHPDHYADVEKEHKEKKGILEMIKEKLPGYHSKSEEEKKEKECD